MWQASLLRIVATSSWPVNLMPCLSNVESFLISSDFTASLGNCSLHPSVTAVCVIPSHLNSSHVFWFFPPHLISSHLMSSLPFLCSSQLITTILISSHVTWAFLISSHLTSAFQLFTALLNSSQLSTARVSSSYVFSSLLSSSHIFWALLTSIQLISALVSSSHLISALLSALSNHLTFSLAQNLLQKRISAPKQATTTLST